MIKNKLTTAVLVLLLVIIILSIVQFLNTRSRSLISPSLGQAGKTVLPSPVSAYNPPKEIKYDSLTDLKKELENINPKVTDDDFLELQN